MCVGGKYNSEVQLNVWREGNTVMCEHTKYENYKSSVDIISETEVVVMELLPYLSSSCKFSILPELLIAGPNNKLQINLQVRRGKDNSKVQLNIWREGSKVMCEPEHTKYNNYKSRVAIISETEEVVMELPCPGFTISATGEARGMWESPWGNFTLTEELSYDRPVYRSSKGWHLYSTESGAWAVSLYVGYSTPYYRSTDQAPSPALCKNWEYLDYGEYKPGEISVTCTVHK